MIRVNFLSFSSGCPVIVAEREREASRVRGVCKGKKK